MTHNALGVVSLQDGSTDTQCHGGSLITGREHRHDAMGVVSLQDGSTDTRCHGGSLITGQEHRHTISMPWG